MLNITFKGRYEDMIKKEADKVKKMLVEKYKNHIEIYGPVPAPRSKIKDNYRYNILLKSRQLQTLIQTCEYMQALNKNSQVDMAWDMDPQDLL